MKKNRKILIALCLVVIGLLLFLNFIKNPEPKIQEETSSPYTNSNIEVITFQGEKGWGYDILIDGVQYVHQPSMPALPGDNGFNTEVHARAVAELMVQKIRQNILPPGVTEEEVRIIIENK